jgi:hypothetical protein
MQEKAVNKHAAATLSLAGLGLLVVSGCARHDTPELLLESQGDPVKPPPFYDDPHLRHRVYINPNTFQMQFGDKVRLNLPDGRSYLVVRQPPEEGGNNAPSGEVQRWEGVIHEPQGEGKAVLESHKGSLSGQITTPSGQYRIIPEPDGGRLIEVNPDEQAQP